MVASKVLSGPDILSLGRERILEKEANHRTVGLAGSFKVVLSV